MNICFVIGAMKFSGAEKVLSMIAKELLENNNRVSVILLEQEYSIIGDEEGIVTYGAKANGNKISRLLHRWSYIRKNVNNYMEVLASLGLIGFILYYSVYAWELYKSYSYRRDNSCQFCFYTLVGILILEIGQITCYYPMIYVFVPLIEYIIRYKEKKGKDFYESKNC